MINAEFARMLSKTFKEAKRSQEEFLRQTLKMIEWAALQGKNKTGAFSHVPEDIAYLKNELEHLGFKTELYPNDMMLSITW